MAYGRRGSLFAGGPSSDDGQTVSVRFAGTPPEVQAPDTVGVPFHFELVHRVTGRRHEVIVIVLDRKQEPKKTHRRSQCRVTSYPV